MTAPSRAVALAGQRLRRDGVQLTLWIVGAAVLAAATYAGVQSAFGSDDARRSLLAAALANPVILLFRGLPSGAGEGAFVAFLIVPFLCLLAALMSAFLAVRHTRAEEESGRADLVGATSAGRMLPVAVTLLHGAAANTAFAIVVALALIAVGLPASGAVVTGAASGGVGLVFLGFAAVAAQVFRTSRAANTAGVSAILLAYLVAGVGNALGTPSDDLQRMESAWPAWLSPFGWAENTRPFSDDTLTPLLPALGSALLLGLGALASSRRRDVGASFLGERTGPAEAHPALRSPTSLLWRLSGGAVLAWSAGAVLAGLLSTTLGSVIEEIGAENPALEAMLARMSAAEGSLEQGILTTFFVMIGIFAACAGVQGIVRVRQEELHGTAEPVLAAAVGRERWLGAAVVVSGIAIALVLTAGVAGASLGIAVSSGEPDLYRSAAVAAGGQLVAAAVFAALTALVFVLAPRATLPLGWGLVATAAVVGLFGPVLGLPDDLSGLSPVAAAPVPVGDGTDIRGLWWMIGTAAAATVAALTLMRRRELAPGG
ncbi:polyketide antibiotic transporter [Microbacterium chocolatum]|uniref:ABC transporter permease n=1 Tax=Microbacterium aurantiacum TaxID=162393 RepID=UPI00338DAD7E